MIQELPTDSDGEPEIPRVGTKRQHVLELFEEHKSEDVSPGKRLVYHNTTRVGAESALKEGTISVGRSLTIRSR